MKILLINPSQKNVYGSPIKPAYPPLGLLYIASVLEKEGHILEIVDFDNDDMNGSKFIHLLSRFKPDVVGLTATTSTIDNTKKLAELAKKILKVPIIIGGIHATIAPEDVLKCNAVDFIVLGEGEITISELLKEMKKNKPNFSKIKGIGYKNNSKTIITPPRPLIENLDSLPFPARHLLKNEYTPPDALKTPVASIFTSRGCPGRCTYCCTKLIFGYRFRFRSIKNVADEIELLLSKGVKEIHIMDDNFTVYKEWVLKFRDEILKRNIKTTFVFANGLRADKIDEEILRALKQIGVLSVGFGVESGNQNILNIIKKDIELDTVRKAYKLSKKLGFETWGFFIIGLPEETKETVRDTIEFAKELDPDFAKFLILKPFPGSEVFNQLNNKNLIFDYNYSHYGVYTAPVHNLENLTAEDMVKMQKKAFKEFYLRPKKILQHLLRMRSVTQLKLNFKSAIFILQKIAG